MPGPAGAGPGIDDVEAASLASAGLAGKRKACGTAVLALEARLATREEVIWLYRCILCREPESESIIEMHSSAGSFEEIRRRLLASEEAYLSRVTATMTKAPVRYRAGIDMGQPSLALASIVKNGAASIGRMLKSCLPVASHFVIYDTGSTDDTIEIVRAILEEASVSHRIETGDFIDFSHARNAALNLVPPDIDWVLMLDADEYIVEADYASLVALTRQMNVEGWQLPRYNFTKSDKQEAFNYPDYQRRLLRNLSGIRYVNPVHEAVIGVSRWGFAPIDLSAEAGPVGGPHIHHTGLQDASEESLAGKRLLYEHLSCL